MIFRAWNRQNLKNIQIFWNLRKSYSKLSLGMWFKVSLVKFNHASSIPHEDMNVIGAIVGIFQSFFSQLVFQAEICFKHYLMLEIAKSWKKITFYEIYVKVIANWAWVFDVRLVWWSLTMFQISRTKIWTSLVPLSGFSNRFFHTLFLNLKSASSDF